MFTFVTLAVLGLLLGIVLMQLFKRQPTPAAPAADLANLKVTDARAGDAISISGAGDNYTDLDFTADRLTNYDAGTRRWFEVSGPYLERRVALRVGGDEEVEVYLHSGARKLTLEDVGLAEEELAEMDERQNTADSFEFDGKVWLCLLYTSFHYPLDTIFRRLGLHSFSIGWALPYAAMLTASSLAVAWVSWRVIEEPCIRLKDQFFSYKNKARAAAA